MKKFKRFLVLLFVLGNIYGLLNGVLYFFQENLIFHPTVLPQEYEYEFRQDFDEVFIPIDDGARLNGLHFKTENPKGVLLYFHGNAGDLQRWGELTTFFVDKGYDVIVMDLYICCTTWSFRNS